ncbi:hypothetical protein [Vibrio maerlii]|uniref:hypothetical protein n=1 Tax=Vibrio maerlii TaxID=2231648 RepID=UPI000E3E82C7|nr:hypothetical protein [Vibrio maerlii]
MKTSAASFFLILSTFLFSPLSLSSENKTLLDRAENGDQAAQLELAKNLSKKPDHFDTSIYWYIQAVTSDQAHLRQQASLELAQLLETSNQNLSSLSVAKSLYSSLDSEYQSEALARIEQQEFDQLRRRQLEALDAQEDIALDDHISNSQQPNELPKDDSWFLITLFVLLICALIGALIYYKRLNVPSSTKQDSPAQSKEAPSPTEQKEIIRKQQKQLKKLFNEIQRLQKEAKQPVKPAPQPASKHNSQLELACALFGFDPSKIPNQTDIKRRYKQLGKIYHPDTLGSSAEMQRLNHALKVILNTTK